MEGFFMTKKLSKKFLSVLVLTVCLSIFTVVPAFANSYSIHAYQWTYTGFSSKANGIYYSLNPGSSNVSVYSTITNSVTGVYSEDYTFVIRRLYWTGLSGVLASSTFEATTGTHYDSLDFYVSESGNYFIECSKPESYNTLEFYGDITN
jgi:hypothetical protein